MRNRPVRLLGAIAVAITLAACPKKPPTPAALPDSGAALFEWRSFYDTDIEIADFFGADHTTQVRFMAQYERAFEGPLFSAGSAEQKFEVGIVGKWVVPFEQRRPRPPVEPYVYIRLVDSEEFDPPIGGPGVDRVAYFPLPNPIAVAEAADWIGPDQYAAPLPASPRWRRLAVVRRGGLLEVWVDGQHLCRKTTPAACDMAAPAASPRGHVRLGKRASAPTGLLETQFYGFIDDVAVFTRALDRADLEAFAQQPRGINERTPDLRVGVNFDRPQPGGTLIRSPATLQGTARIVEVTASHDNWDFLRLPIVTNSAPVTLPFIGREVWQVAQEFATRGSHAHGAAFCWDFVYVPPSHPRGRPVGDSRPTNGRRFVAGTAGRIAGLMQASFSSTEPSNMVSIQRSNDDFHGYLHFQQNSIVQALGDAVSRGAPLGLVGNTGTDEPHLHACTADRSDERPQLVTRPSYFVDYCWSDDFGMTWKALRFGMPRMLYWVKQLPADGSCEPAPG